jgi:hypothetical protein
MVAHYLANCVVLYESCDEYTVYLKFQVHPATDLCFESC